MTNIIHDSNASANNSSATTLQPKHDLRVSHLQLFTGDRAMDAAQWLRIFERHAKRNNFTDSEKVDEAVYYLSGQAEKWYTDECDREKIRPDATWAQWKAAFTRKYVETETTMELLDKLSEVHQGKGESVLDYGVRVQDLVRKIGPDVTSKSVLIAFKKGLLPVYRVELEMNDYVTLDEAIGIVVRKEKLGKIERTAAFGEKPQGKDETDKLVEKMEKLKLRLVNAESVARKNNACFNCFEGGHTSSECPKRNSKKAYEKGKSGELRWMSHQKHDEDDVDFVEVEVDQEELFNYLEVDQYEEIRVLEKRPFDEEGAGNPEAKRLKLRIPAEVFKKKQAIDDARKTWNNGDGFAPRKFNLEQKISTMSSGMTLAQAIEECPRVRNQMKQFCDSKHEARTIVAEPTSTPSTTVRVADEEFGVLIDGGASVNIMSKEVVTKLGLSVTTQGKLTRLTLGDGRKIFTNEMVRGVELNFDKLKVIVDFLILKTPDYPTQCC